MNSPNSLLWIVFFVVTAAAILTDLLLHRRGRGSPSPVAAWGESFAWIALALLFDLWIWHVRGRQASVEFLTAYVVEKSLSIDNIFLFFVIFRSFRVSPRAQHRVLYYGVAGALILRAAFVFAGVALLNRFHTVTYLFGIILLVAAAQMVFPRRPGSENKQPWITRFVQRILPIHSDTQSEHFLVRENGKWLATTLLLALVAVELMDLIFAVDSVPAVLAITRDPLLAYSSNVFAILGLRAIYFVLAQLLQRVRFLHQGLAAVLAFVGGKMIGSDYVEIGAGVSLGVIATIFAITLLTSYLFASPSKA